MAKRKPASEKGLAYIAEWDRQNSVRYSIKLSKTADADIIEWLSEQPNKNGSIKEAIRLLMRMGRSEG